MMRTFIAIWVGFVAAVSSFPEHPHVWDKFQVLLWRLLCAKAFNYRLRIVHFFCVRLSKIVHFFRMLPLKCEILFLRFKNVLFYRKQCRQRLAVRDGLLQLGNEVDSVLDRCHVFDPVLRNDSVIPAGTESLTTQETPKVPPGSTDCSPGLGCKTRIPDAFRPATVRVVTPSDGKFMGIGFDVDGRNETWRVRLTIEHAHQLAELIRSQSDVCNGMPSCDVSKKSPVVA